MASKIDAILKKIEEDEAKLEELNEALEICKAELDETQGDIDQTEQEVSKLKKEMDELLFFSKTGSQADYIDYLVNNDTRAELRGQYSFNSRWTMTNGYVLVDSDQPFPYVPSVLGVPIGYDCKVTNAHQSIDFDLDAAERRVLKNDMEVIKIGTAWVQRKLVQLVIGIVGKPLCVKCFESKEAIAMECENGRALVLPVRVDE